MLLQSNLVREHDHENEITSVL